MLPISFDLNHNKLLCPGIHTLFDFTQPKPNEYGDGQDSANKDENKIYVKRIHTASPAVCYICPDCAHRYDHLDLPQYCTRRLPGQG